MKEEIIAPQLKQTEVVASFTGTIDTGNYCNEKPFFSLKEVWTGEIDVEKRQRELHNICYNQFKRQAEVAYQEKIAKTYQNIRFYDYEDGKKVPSVTSIIGMDKDFHVSPEELAQYGARGTLIHKQVELFLTTGVWHTPETLEECSHEYLTVINGSLGLDFGNIDFRAFYKEYPFTVIECEKTTVNSSYGGRIDIIAKIDSKKKGKWDKIENVVYDTPIILDIKTSTSLDKLSGFTQQSAYCKSEGIEHMGLIHLNKENKCGYAKPVISNHLTRYFNLFLNKRELFRQRYGV